MLSIKLINTFLKLMEINWRESCKCTLRNKDMSDTSKLLARFAFLRLTAVLRNLRSVVKILSLPWICQVLQEIFKHRDRWRTEASYELRKVPDSPNCFCPTVGPESFWLEVTSFFFFFAYKTLCCHLYWPLIVAAIIFSRLEGGKTCPIQRILNAVVLFPTVTWRE